MHGGSGEASQYSNFGLWPRKVTGMLSPLQPLKSLRLHGCAFRGDASPQTIFAINKNIYGTIAFFLMNRKNTAARLWQYITECARLLYWAYFKPYTLDRWLQEIHPELNRNINPFRLQDGFPNNRRLYRYAEQFWWLSATVPLLALLLVVRFYYMNGGESSSWLLYSLFLLGWSVGLLLARLNLEKLEKWSNRGILTVCAIVLLLGIRFYLEFKLCILASGVAFGVASGVLSVVGLYLEFAVAVIIVGYFVVFFAALGTKFNIKLYVGFNFKSDLALFIAFSVSISLMILCATVYLHIIKLGFRIGFTRFHDILGTVLMSTILAGIAGNAAVYMTGNQAGNPEYIL